MTMADLALQARDPVTGEVGAYSYGDDPSNPRTWDANMLQGCLCDSFGYFRGTADRLAPFIGPDCAMRACPVGPDPSTFEEQAETFEVQSVSCLATAGTFVLSFRGEPTSPLSYAASIADLKIALENLTTLGTVQVGGASLSPVRLMPRRTPLLAVADSMPALNHLIHSLLSACSYPPRPQRSAGRAWRP
jgi:hypothetical protein